MPLVTNFAITDAARAVLDRRKTLLKPDPFGVFALSYWASFKEPDGTSVQGFEPGWIGSGVRHQYLGEAPLFVLLPHGTTFYLMPRDGWDENGRYVMDLINTEYETYSITPSP